MHKLWPKMEEIYKSGKAKTIGVSNFNVQLLFDLLSYAEIKPAVNRLNCTRICRRLTQLSGTRKWE